MLGGLDVKFLRMDGFPRLNIKAGSRIIGWDTLREDGFRRIRVRVKAGSRPIPEPYLIVDEATEISAEAWERYAARAFKP